MAVGAYLENDIRDAYVFLMQHYHPGDRVFFFGFSRGAYTVRAVASLLRMYGLLRQGNETLVPYAIRMMMAITKARKTEEDRRRHAQTIAEYFDLAQQLQGDDGARLQAALRRRLGHGELGRLDRQPAQAAVSRPTTATSPSGGTPSPSTSAGPSSAPTCGVRAPTPTRRTAPSTSSRCGSPACTATSAAAIPKPRAGSRSWRSNGCSTRWSRMACSWTRRSAARCSAASARS